MENIHIPERMEGEEFSDYQDRRIASHMFVKEIKRGTYFWNSAEKGTYVKPIDAVEV